VFSWNGPTVKARTRIDYRRLPACRWRALKRL
jgi:hypothetical protein